MHLGKFFLVPAIETGILVDLRFDVCAVRLFHLLTFTKPCLLLFVHLFAQVCVVLVPNGHLLMRLLSPCTELIKMDGLGVGRLTLLLLDPVHELIDLILKLLLKADLHLGVFLELVRRLCDPDLELLA